MESNETTLTISSNQTSLNLNPDSNPNSNSINSNNSISNANDNLQFIDYSNFEEISLLSNESDEIFKAHWKDANSLVALKKIKSQSMEYLRSSQKLSYHPNVLSIFGFSKDPNSQDYFLVTEYANGGNLRKYLKENHKSLSWDDKMKLAIDITSGLQCLHSHGIIHLKLTPYNIFVHNNKSSIGDSSDMSDISIPENIDIKILPYLDPKFIANTSYPRDKKSDIYSLGLILYELSSGKAPFALVPYHTQLSNKILSGEKEKPISGTPIEYIVLYEQCWDDEPDIRPNAEDVLARLGRMNLSPVYEDIEDAEDTENTEDTEIVVNHHHRINIDDKLNEIEVISESSTRNQIDSILLDLTGSAFGESRERLRQGTKKKERKCKMLPWFPRFRLTFGAFLCWMLLLILGGVLILVFFLPKVHS